MKELSIKEKAKRYDEALEIAKNINNEHRAQPFDVMTRVFSELKESEDEKIKSAILKALMADEAIDILVKCGIYYEDVESWLEKQGKQEINDKDTIQSYSFYSYKGEPNFKVGDWIVSNASHEDYRICKILKIENEEYIIESIYGYQGHNNFETFDKDYHLWTINDVKDGDVLIDGNNNIGIYKEGKEKDGFWDSYTYLGCDNYLRGLGGYHERKNTKPATKEQRDKLGKAITEAGYKWDANKKELKKIPSFCREHCKGYQETGRCFVDGECQAKKNAELYWSEEDELMLNDILTCGERHYHLDAENISWLKSLKDRIQLQWKPSEEHMKLLKEVQQALLGKDCHNRFVNFMCELKRLKEE